MKINELILAVVLALVFGVLIEAGGDAIYYWIGTTYGHGMFLDFWLFIHWPIFKLIWLIYPPNQWPGVGAHILDYTFSVCAWWVISFAGTWTFVRLYRVPRQKLNKQLPCRQR